MKLQVLILAVALGGCVSVGKEPMTMADGQSGYLLRCGGVLFSMADCASEARRLCGGDYTELNRSITPRGDSGTESRTIEIVCKR